MGRDIDLRIYPCTTKKTISAVSCVVGKNLYGDGSAPDGGAWYYISNGDIEVLQHTIDTHFMLSIWYILQAHHKKTDGLNIACNGSTLLL